MGRFSLTTFQTAISAAASKRHFRYFQYLVIVLLCTTFTIGAVAAFPTFDDGYLMLLLKERGVNSIFPAHPDRPLVGWMWQLLATLFGAHFWAFGFLSHLGLWSLFGIEATLLWNHLFPEWKRYGGVVGCLTVAPIVVQIQLSTVTITLLGLLSVVLGYAAILLMFNFIDKNTRSAFVLALMLLSTGVLVSEYAVPVALAGSVLALKGYAFKENEDKKDKKARASKASIAMLGVAAVVYVVYRALEDHTTAVRADVSPDLPLHNMRMVLTAPLAMLTHLWRVTFGAYGTTMGNLTLSWGEKSSIIAPAYGLVIGLLLVICSRQHPPEVKVEARYRNLFVLLIALTAGLTPIVLMRPLVTSPFKTRFHIPILPLAAMITTCIALTVARARARIAVVGLLGVFIGTAVFAESWAAYRRQVFMRSLGETLEPYVASSEGVTVAVLPNREYCDSGIFCTAKTTLDWPAQLSTKFWLFTSDEARAEIGDRTTHSAAGKIHKAIRMGTTVLRDGEIVNVMWIELRDGQVTVEPYYFREGCLREDSTLAENDAVNRRPEQQVSR